MKKIFITTILFMVSISVFAGMTCRENILGNTVCTGTGDDTGYRYEIDTDILGNDRYRDNQGNSMTCSTNILGDYVCN